MPFSRLIFTTVMFQKATAKNIRKEKLKFSQKFQMTATGATCWKICKKKYARLQTFPNYWNFSGSLSSQYKQELKRSSCESCKGYGTQPDSAVE